MKEIDEVSILIKSLKDDFINENCPSGFMPKNGKEVHDLPENEKNFFDEMEKE